jgi:hypothetical protein
MKLTIQNISLYTIMFILFVNLLFFNNKSVYGTDIPMYPTPEFTNVEKICRELCSDLDVLNFNRTLHNDWVENSDYLFNKFLILNNAINSLVNNKEESRSYLLEDINYLINTIQLVEMSYSAVYEPYKQNPLCRSMFTLLKQSNEKLHELLSLNLEII